MFRKHSDWILTIKSFFNYQGSSNIQFKESLLRIIAFLKGTLLQPHNVATT